MVYSKSVRKATNAYKLQYQDSDRAQRSSRGTNRRRRDNGTQARTAQTAARERGQEKDRREGQDGTRRQVHEMDSTIEPTSSLANTHSRKATTD